MYSLGLLLLGQNAHTLDPLISSSPFVEIVSVDYSWTLDIVCKFKVCDRKASVQSHTDSLTDTYSNR